MELEPLQFKYSNLCEADKSSENSVCASILLYMSKGAVKRCLNCNVYRNGALVTCRHLAAWWLKLKEFEYGMILIRKIILSDAKKFQVMQSWEKVLIITDVHQKVFILK